MSLDLPLPAVLTSVADELVELSALADSIGASTLDPIERLQPLDRLSQHLSALAGFFVVVADAVPGVATNIGPALEAVPVGALADRLAGRASEPVAESGYLDLF